MKVDDLIARLEDESATFSRDETTELIDWYVDLATSKDIHDMRKELEQETLTRICDANAANLSKLSAAWDSAPMAPTLQVIRYE